MFCDQLNCYHFHNYNSQNTKECECKIPSKGVNFENLVSIENGHMNFLYFPFYRKTIQYNNFWHSDEYIGNNNRQ